MSRPSSWTKPAASRFAPILFGFILMTAGAGNLLSQQATIQGKVCASDGIILPGASVRIIHTDLRATTNADGEFIIRAAPTGVAQIAASLQGFSEEVRTIYLAVNAVTVVNFSLRTEKISVETEVVAERPLLSASTPDNRITITPAQIENLPSLGERDIFRAFQLLPGITGSNEASSGLYVRGGTPDQNLILFDGFTLYHVEHLYGYFSPFNPNAVRDVRLSKGGFEAKYGGRLSSVLELSGEPGPKDQWTGGLGASFLSVDGFLGIPLWDKGSFLFAFRRSFQTSLYDALLEKFGSDSSEMPRGQSEFGGMNDMGFNQYQNEAVSYFYDLNAKLSLDLSKRDRLEISFYNGQDKLDNSREMQAPPFITEEDTDFSAEITDLTNWGNYGLSAVGTREWSDRFRSRFVLSASRYFYNRERETDADVTFPAPEGDEDRPSPFSGSNQAGQNEDNELNDVGAKWENELLLSDTNTLEFGLEAVENRVKFNLQMDDASVFGFRREEDEDVNMVGLLDQNNRGLQVSGYLQDRWTLWDQLTVTPGLRITRYDGTASTYFEPRFNARFELSPAFSLKAAWGVYHQFANRILREDVTQGDRTFWALADGENVPVGKATHYLFGASWRIKGWVFDAEGYYKDLSGVTEYSLRMAPPDEENPNYGQLFFRGTGTARGVEFFIQKTAGAYTGWISYTLSKTRYTISAFGEDPYPASQDIPNEFKFVNSLALGRWTLSATWIYATGRPYTATTGLEASEDFDGRTIYRVVTGEKNGARLPDYHRLDLSVVYKFHLGSTEPHLGLSVFNAYDRANVWYKEYQTFTGELIEEDITLMGLTFNLFLTIKF